jgi:RNA polymerase-binding transcription factor
MDRQSLDRFRRALKSQRDIVHLRLVLAREQGRVQDQSEVTDEGDRGRAETDKQMSAVQQTQAQDLLTNINTALDRIDAGTFGECLNCGQEINTRRLEAIPSLRYCITCQELIDGSK